MHVLVGACTESDPITCSAQGASWKLSATRWWGCCKWSPGWHGQDQVISGQDDQDEPPTFPRYSFHGLPFVCQSKCPHLNAAKKREDYEILWNTMNINLAAHKIKLPDSQNPQNHQCSGKHLSEKRQWWSQRLAKQLAILRPFGTHSWPQSNRFVRTFLV